MLHIENLDKHYYCPLKSNRQVDDSNAQTPYRRVDALQWSEGERRHGKRVKIRGFPRHHKVKLFRVAFCNGRTDYVVTNDLAQNDTRLHNRRVTSDGRLISRQNRPVLRSVSVAWHGLFAITSGVQCWFGFDSSKWRIRQTKPFIRSNTVYSMNTCEIN